MVVPSIWQSFIQIGEMACITPAWSSRKLGLKKNVIKRDLDHSHYLACLQNNTVEQYKMRTIRSDHYVVSSYEINKTSLSCFDDKRYILPDGRTSYANGHWNLRPQ